MLYAGTQEKYSYEAAQLAEQQRNTLLLNLTSFCLETVDSHPSNNNFAALADGLGYAMIMVVIHLEQAEL